MSNIVLAIEKAEKYKYDKLVLGLSVNILDYIKEAGYTSVKKFGNDRRKYYKENIETNLKLLNIKCIENSATLLQPEAYNNYENKTNFCFYVEYDKPMALTPLNYDNTFLIDNGFDCFAPGYITNGCIISYPDDFNCAISFKAGDVPEISPKYFINRFKDLLNKYYDNKVTVNNNDLMYDGKKIAGTASYIKNDIFMFCIHISFVNPKNDVDRLGFAYEKEPSNLPYVENIKDTIKKEVQLWLH